ncbi:hypothetical protein ECTOBSL9_2210 [Ectothiorhodospira sp. BSL-9]|nr:hypothetical protein ECTOBSL9_2210 [Ectothiorhodospira sp. BSL-9]
MSDNENVFRQWEHSSVEDKVIVEKSTSYIEFPQVAINIKSFFQDAKVVFLLRDPVERAISNYFFSRKNGLEIRGILDALFDDGYEEIPYSTSVNPYNYLGRGVYVDYIRGFYDVLDESQVLLVVMEKLYSDFQYRKSVMMELGFPDLVGISVEKTNAAVRGAHVDYNKGLVDSLASYYGESNLRLQAEYGVDISLWR